MQLEVAEVVDRDPYARLGIKDLNREPLQSLIQKYGERLAPRKPTGYAGSEALVGFFFGTPNNTLPMFWSSRDGWNPLLPYGESARDPQGLLVPPAGVPGASVQRKAARSHLELVELTTLDDVMFGDTFPLLAEMQRIPVFLAMCTSLERFDRKFYLGHLATMLAELGELRHENEPVASMVVVVPDGNYWEVVGNLVLDAREQGLSLAHHLAEIKQLVQLIDTARGGLLLDSGGGVIGLLEWSEELSTTMDPFIPARLQGISRFSERLDGLAFFFEGVESRTHVFDRGARILSRRGANWNLHLRGALEPIAKLAGLDSDVVEGAMRVAHSLADAGHGGLLCIGDEKAVLSMVGDHRQASGWIPQSIVRDSDSSALLARIAQDGATVVNREGEVIETQVTLVPPRTANLAPIKEDGGTRHEAAALTSAATKALVVVVSSTGTITMVHGGLRVGMSG